MAIEATYHDGRTAVAHRVEVRIEPPVLRMIGDDEREIARWPLDAVRHVEKPVPGQVVRLRNGFGADDRLTLPLGTDAGFLAPYCPDIGKGDPAWKRAWKPLLFLGGGTVATIALLFLVVVPFLATKLADAVPPRWEAEFGEEAAQQLIRILAVAERKKPDAMVCAAPNGRAALERMADRLTAGTELPSPIRLQVVDSRRLNAFTLPGGQILVMRGLIDFVEDPNELAGVIAHEIGHAAHRDPLRMVVERSGTAATFGLLFGDIFGGFALAGMSEALVNGSYTREKERAADDFGVELMNRAGFDATGLAAFFERIKQKEGDIKGVMGFFATHPAFADRSAAVRGSAASGNAALDAAEWRAVKQMCAKRN